jgi:hypothetical protein
VGREEVEEGARKRGARKGKAQGRGGSGEEGHESRGEIRTRERSVLENFADKRSSWERGTSSHTAGMERWLCRGSAGDDVILAQKLM